MIGIGIIGLGTVGVGTFRILNDSNALLLEKTGLDVRVVKVADIDLDRDRGIDIERGILTKDAYEVIEDKDVDIVVELVGGITPAFDYICSAIKRKKWVVTANKALLAEKGDEIFALIEKENCEIGFEASVCGGIPVIRAIRDGLVGNNINYILGILNGTSNYILTKMTEEGVSFGSALKDAQNLGYAEQDPTLDIEGIDAAHKLSILIRLAFHCPVVTNDILTSGITKIEPIDIEFAREFGYRIKLIGLASEKDGFVDARVEPAMIPLSHPMSNVNGVYNAVYVVGDRVGPNLFYGKGAGADPTGSSVVSDIIDMAYRINARDIKARIPRFKNSKVTIRKGGDSQFPFYMRITTEDRTGVLSKISGILSNYDISISTVIQKGRKEKGHVPIVMLTHEASENNLKKAKVEIDRLPFIKGESVHIRIEEGNL
ncbi:MAG TPA: homoserine dehydrogenase [Syntrophorhabdaceae bacterium]|jgi:homoserine dehydrogenase|nr:Homoserine dehydrogenase [Syntrophorhabdaceae bacterium]HNQ62740.1 homoserine dehydrogenase [Syntrophorhabdaceae bacterium]HNZ58051.1 homoserine dehydrogenase [Syntrophorhabdaceae bacterium]HOB69032.1 homoserine dehydrogenase [Syntrophorhabdaceae bacterium]HPH41349.1 homoserine dehydrogenase [Syntrophorhabdaceae bacterium]